MRKEIYIYNIDTEFVEFKDKISDEIKEEISKNGYNWVVLHAYPGKHVLSVFCDPPNYPVVDTHKTDEDAVSELFRHYDPVEGDDKTNYLKSLLEGNYYDVGDGSMYIQEVDLPLRNKHIFEKFMIIKFSDNMGTGRDINVKYVSSFSKRKIYETLILKNVSEFIYMPKNDVGYDFKPLINFLNKYINEKNTIKRDEYNRRIYIKDCIDDILKNMTDSIVESFFKWFNSTVGEQEGTPGKEWIITEVHRYKDSPKFSSII